MSLDRGDDNYKVRIACKSHSSPFVWVSCWLDVPNGAQEPIKRDSGGGALQEYMMMGYRLWARLCQVAGVQTLWTRSG